MTNLPLGVLSKRLCEKCMKLDMHDPAELECAKEEDHDGNH